MPVVCQALAIGMTQRMSCKPYPTSCGQQVVISHPVHPFSTLF